MLIWSQEAFISGLALSLLHSLWQGALLGLAGLALRNRLKQATPDVRCTAFYSLLLTFFMIWLGTFGYLYGQTTQPGVAAVDFQHALLSNGLSGLTAARPAPSTPLHQLHSLAPLLVVAWALGVCLLSLRHLGGLLLLRRWCRRETAPCPPAWQACAERLAQQMGIGKKILLRCSAQIDVPFAFGLFKASIMLPLNAMLGLTTEQIEALIAHELAHIARYDVLFNFVQVCVETILFYHPVVWWFSAQIRVAREQRCDDLAVQVIGDRALYARALYSLEEARAAIPQLALGAKGDHSRMTNRHLIHRIQRVLGVSSPEKRDPWAKGVLALGAAAIGLATLAPVQAYSRQAQQKPSAKQEKIVKVVSTKILLNINGDDIELNTSDLKPDTPVKVNGKEGKFSELNATQQKQLQDAVKKIPSSDELSNVVQVKVHKNGDGASFSVARSATNIMLNINGDRIELHDTDLKPNSPVKVNGKEGKFGDLNATQQKQLQDAVKKIPSGDMARTMKLHMLGGGGATHFNVSKDGAINLMLNINGAKIELHDTDLKPDTPVKVNGKEGKFGELNATQQKQLRDAVGNVHVIVSPDPAHLEEVLQGLDLSDDIKKDIIIKVQKELPPADKP